MTSRPPSAFSQRQPQRSSSGSGLSQRAAPTLPRAVPQQYLPLSPARRTESTNDATADANNAADSAQGRLVATARRAGSRLKLELANDGIEHQGFSESPVGLDPLSANRVFTPSHLTTVTDAMEPGDITSPRVAASLSADSDSQPSLPMPPRKRRLVLPIMQPRQPQTAPSNPRLMAPARKDQRPKPFASETPPQAPRHAATMKAETLGVKQTQKSKETSNRKKENESFEYADYYPWLPAHPPQPPNHAEEAWGDGVIRNGYFDKAPSPPQSELASARASGAAVLKHKTGVQTLSSIFTGILAQRRQRGQVTAPSTFKPPPRVTLTDTKREVWLKDLANPAISLRRLSRTIPHGIRGKILLDQCLNKHIPTDRAVWLAKCVGANEIRAFRRKGVNGNFVLGGEAKWIRDWTVFVEQFVESVVGAVTESDWKAKVTYAIRLATHIYAEHLMDRDHYMDWLVCGLENSTQARLPMWLLIIHIYWKDLLRMRKFGRRLTTAILQHHADIYKHPDRDVLMSLSNKLSSLLQSLILSSPECFVHPPTWAKYRAVVESCLANDDEVRRHALGKIHARNEEVTSTHIRSKPGVRSVIVKLLDTTLRKPFNDDIAGQLWEARQDEGSIVRTVLEWCTSPYRPGISKVYVAANIIRKWAMVQVDATRAVLDFLDLDPLEEQDRRCLLYHLVSELIRTGDFSMPAYLQWLIVRGGISDPVETHPDGPCHTRLLVEVPLHSLSKDMRSLRRSMLQRARFSVETEASNMANAMRCVKQALSIPLEAAETITLKKPMSMTKLAKRIGLSSRALKSELGFWLSSELIAGLAARTGKDTLDLPILKFDGIRTLLQAADDYTMMEQAVKSLLVSSNANLLASCVDTINLHLQIYAATGSAIVLFHAFLDRLKAIVEEQGIGARPLLESLARLAPRIPGLEDVAVQLQKDLNRADRSSKVDASSPLSDSMAMQLQDDETELNEEIESFANDFTSVDVPTMTRLFQIIINRLQSCCLKEEERQRRYCAMLTRLRVFNMHVFDTLMRGWVQHIRRSTIRPYVAQMYPILVSAGCLPLATLFATIPWDPTLPSPVGFASIYIQEMLQMLTMPLSPTRVMTSEDCFRLRILQEQARFENATEMMHLIRGALAEYASRDQETPIWQPLENDEVKAQLRELLRSLILFDPAAASQVLSVESTDAKLVAYIESITTELLMPQSKGVQKSLEQVLELTNEFSLPFCQVKLSLHLSLDDGGAKLQSQIASLSKAMDNAIDANNIMWTGVLPFLKPEVMPHLRERAESRFLDLMPSVKASAPNAQTIHMSENLLTIIESLIRSGPDHNHQISSQMADKLADSWEILTCQNAEVVPLKEAVMSHWLPLLLSHLALHATSPPTTSDSPMPAVDSTRARLLLTLAGVIQELESLRHSPLSRRAFDVAMVIVDFLGNEARLQCVRAIKDTTSDPKLRYLFSFAADPSENLMLGRRDKTLTHGGERRGTMTGYAGRGGVVPENLSRFVLRRWEILNEPTPNVGENDTSLSLALFEARKV